MTDSMTPEHLKVRTQDDPEGKEIAEQMAKRLKGIKTKYFVGITGISVEAYTPTQAAGMVDKMINNSNLRNKIHTSGVHEA